MQVRNFYDNDQNANAAEMQNTETLGRSGNHERVYNPEINSPASDKSADFVKTYLFNLDISVDLIA
jgi:deoxyribodipyrimidine photolyase